jgi:putative sigma-54 modulation protein
MKFEYTGRHIDVTPALKNHVEEHFGRLSHLFDGDNVTAHVIIEVEKNRNRSEVILKWRKEVLTANTINSDMYKSLSQTIDKIEKQASRLKSKITDKHQKVKKVSTITPSTDVIAAPPDSPRIINSKSYAVKPMTIDEAALSLDAEENQFLVFRNADDERLSVIYKRKDGNYGLINP